MTKKSRFKFLSNRSDGLTLRIHHKIQENEMQRSIIFISASISDNGELLACSDHSENLYIFDLINSLYWKSLNKAYVTLSFANFNQLYISRKEANYCINCINISNGKVATVLIGHQFRASRMIISSDHSVAITYCSKEAILWELKHHTKLLKLNLNEKKVMNINFSPVSNNIVACFDNHKIQIWNKETLECIDHFLPQKLSDITCFAFTSNGRTMVLAGASSKLSIINMDSWSVDELLLHERISGIKKIVFLSYGLDGGANRFLLFFTSNCMIHYYDTVKKITFYVLKPEFSSVRDILINSNGKYLACLLKCGEINLYMNSIMLETYMKKTQKIIGNKIMKKDDQNLINCNIEDCNGDEILTNCIDKKRLKRILFYFNEYPNKYRITIWSCLLNTPNNRSAYMNLISKPIHPLCSIVDNYDLKNTIYLKHLKRILSCLFHCSPDLMKFDFLIEFIFPFVKSFFSDPLSCFEIIVTILMNYSNSWFRLSPLIPIHVLAIVENILADYDKTLLEHFMRYNITSEIYGWSLMKTGFSEVLTTSEWSMLWDHIVSNKTDFLLFSVVSYNIINRNVLFNLAESQSFQLFFCKQNPINMKSFLKTTYKLYNNISYSNFYFKMNNKLTLPKGESYPQYIHHPFDCKIEL